MRLDLNDDGSRMQQDVALDYRENMIEIEPPPIEGKTASTIMHSFTEVKFCIFLSFVIRSIVYCAVWHD